VKWLFLQTWVLLLVSFLIGALVTWLVTRPRKKAGAAPADTAVAAVGTPDPPASPATKPSAGPAPAPAPAESPSPDPAPQKVDSGATAAADRIEATAVPDARTSAGSAARAGVAPLAVPSGRVVVDDLGDGPDLDTPAMGFPAPTRRPAPPSAPLAPAVRSMNSTPRSRGHDRTTATSSSRPAARRDAVGDGFAGSADDTVVIDADVAAGRPAVAKAPAAVPSPYPGGVLPLTGGAAPSAEFVIKGNIDSMLYHDRTSPSYRQTVAEVWFRDSDDAEDAGFRPWNWRARTTGNFPKLGADGLPVDGSTLSAADTAALAAVTGRSSTSPTPADTPTTVADPAPASSDGPAADSGPATTSTADAAADPDVPVREVRTEAGPDGSEAVEEAPADNSATSSANATDADAAPVTDVAAGADNTTASVGVVTDVSNGPDASAQEAQRAQRAGAEKPGSRGALGMVAGVDTDESDTHPGSTNGDRPGAASTNGRVGGHDEPAGAPHSAMQGLTAPDLTEAEAEAETETQPTPAAEAASPYGPGSVLPTADGSAPSDEYLIKGNADSMLYHTTDSPYYGRTRPVAWFRTEEDAQRAGFSAWNRRARQTARAMLKPAFEEGRYPGSAKPGKDGGAPTAEFTVKASEDSMLYYTKASPLFGVTIAEVWFRSEADAQRAGFTAWHAAAHSS